MLKEIFCDKFISYGEPRGKITFHKGLNVVQGHNTGTNSIGKSTFLLVVDFAFGGDTYVKDDKIINKIGHHTINFKFVFNDVDYYFSRSTETPDLVNICNSDYTIKTDNETLSLDDYKNKLFLLYNINLEQISFRQVVGLFFRVYGRGSSDEKFALSSHKNEAQKISLLNFLKLYNKYSVIEEKNNKIKSKEKESKAYLQAAKYELVKIITKTQYKNNKLKLLDLQEELDTLARIGGEELLDKNSNEIKIAADYKARYNSLIRKKKILWSRYYNIKNNLNQKKPCTTQDFESLKQFFPNCNIKLITDIEKFHSEITNILSEEFQTEMSKILRHINELAIEISKIENAMEEINLPIKISKNVLDNYSRVNKEYQTLQNENIVYSKKAIIDAELKENRNSYEKLFLEQYEILSKKVNNKIFKLHKQIYGENVESPILEVAKTTSYTFGTPNDNGTGTNNKNLILLDLASLSLSPLPCVAHDTIIFKHIGKTPMSKILQIYNSYEKQIFIAIDETIRYSQEAQKIINYNTILQLSDNGNELYGNSWSKREIEKLPNSTI